MLITVEKTNTGVCFRNLFTVMKKKKMEIFLWKPVQTIESKQHEIVRWKYFEVMLFAVTAVVKQNDKLRLGTGKPLPVFS